MRLIKWLFWLVVAVILVAVGFANTEPATLTLVPPDIEPYLGFNQQITLPLFQLIFGGVLFGLIVGFVWEWLREFKQRSAAVNARRDKAVLEAEVKRLKADRNQHDDDVLALLEGSSTAR